MPIVETARANRSDAGERRISASPSAHAIVAMIIVPRTIPITIKCR